RLAVAHVHVDAARQARVEAPHRPHDVDALEVVRSVLLEDRHVLHRVLVRPRGAVAVARARVPGRRRVRVVAILPSRMTRWCESTPRTAAWNPQPIASSGTSKSVNTRVSPERTRPSASS